MPNNSDDALTRAERTVEYIVRTFGHSSPEYFRALREYQSILHRTMQSMENDAPPQHHADATPVRQSA